jgi:hypothetical protein
MNVKTKRNLALNRGKNKTRRVKPSSTYKKSEFNSGEGMLTTVWGPSLWHFLHTMSFNYPVEPTVEDKKHYRDFILSLRYTLPCKYCRMNLKTNFKQLPITLETMKNRDTFSRYIYDLHELINKMLHKKSNLTFCQVRERYEHFRARCTSDPSPVLAKYDPNEKIVPKSKLEKGCTEPLYGKKSKCIIKIVPQDMETETFQMDEECIKKRG